MYSYSVSIDPDEEEHDESLFDGLHDFLQNGIDDNEREHFKTFTLKNLAKRAQSLKSLRPPRGISFSLQQQRKIIIFSLCNKLV